MLSDMMIHRLHPPRFIRSHRLPALLVVSCLLASCGAQDTGGNPAAPANATTVPPGGMGPGAVVAPTVRPGVAATPTSAPVVPVATVVRPAVPTAPPTAVPVPPTDIPVPPTSVPATSAPATQRTKATVAPTERATATERAALPSPAATVKGTVTPSATPHMVTYTVKKGDDVYGIARHFGVTPAAIVSANNLTNPSKIKIGQVLKVPVVGPSSETPAA
jgi:membrane-bound lytic murein transglycosylase D